MMKDTPIKILDHIYYRDEASLKSNKFRIASNDSQRMIDKNFSVCILYSDERSLLIELNEKEYDIKEIIKKNMTNRVIHISDQKKISILSCEEDEEEYITRILGKIYDLYPHLSSDNF